MIAKSVPFPLVPMRHSGALHFGPRRSLICVMRFMALGLTFLIVAATALKASPPKKPAVNGAYVATAYSVAGITAAGTYTHRHVLAADPDILPLGSRVRIRRAGRYSGEYVVADTGDKIVGRKLDIYLPSTAECKKFGRKTVRLRVIEMGKGTAASAQQADKEVKKDVTKDVQQGAVGRAATEADWTAKKKSQTNPPASDTGPH